MREGAREGEREGAREGEREGAREGEREGAREGEREEGRGGGGIPQPTQIPKRIHTQGHTQEPHCVIYQQLLDY